MNEEEVIEVLEKPAEDRAGREGARIALGKTASGRYVRGCLRADPEPDSVFVITAYELSGKPLAAFPGVEGKNSNEPNQVSIRTG